MASFLSPIISGGESSSTSDGRDYDTAATIEAPECRRLISAGPNQCQTPSTSSQVSELDDETNTSHEHHHHHHHHHPQTHSGGTRNNNSKATSSSQARASSLGSSSTASGGSLAQQFLLHHHDHDHRSSTSSSSSSSTSPLSDDYKNNNNNTLSSINKNKNNNHHHRHNHNHHISNLYLNLKQTKRFKQILQSIPLPLVATSILTVLILCLLLSECKSLQLAQGAGSVQSMVMEQEQQASSVSPSIAALEAFVEQEDKRQPQEEVMQQMQLIQGKQQEDSQPAARLVTGGLGADSPLASIGPFDGAASSASFRPIKLARHRHQQQPGVPEASLLLARGELEDAQNGHPSQQSAVEGAAGPADELEPVSLGGGGGGGGGGGKSALQLLAPEGLADQAERVEAGGQPGSDQKLRQQQQQQLDFEQLELKRQILRDLFLRHRQQANQFRQFQAKRHYQGEVYGEQNLHHNHNHHHQQQPAQLNRDNPSPTLLLLASSSAEGAGSDTSHLAESQGSDSGSVQQPGELLEQQQQRTADRFFGLDVRDGRDAEPVRTTGHNMDNPLGPANLRSSNLELDSLSQEAESQLPSARHLGPVSLALVSEPPPANHRHRHQHQLQHPSHPQQQQQQQQHNHKLTNEEHVKNHQQHGSGGSGSGNNHDRPFDVYQIQCNNTEEGFERFACPTADNLGRFRCIEDSLFCDGYYDCPGGEDENRISCMYYKLFVSHIDILTNTFLTWMKKQNRQQGAHRSLAD